MLANPYRPYLGQIFQSKLASKQDDQLLLSLVVGNKPGVLGRISQVFSRRGFNIEYLNVHHTLDQRLSHMMIMIKGSSERFSEIVKNCQKIVDVIHVTPVHQGLNEKKNEQQALRIELSCEPQHKKLILQCLQYSSFQIVDFAENALIIEKDHREHTDEAMLAILKHYASIRVFPRACLEDEDQILVQDKGHASPAKPLSQLC